MKTYFVFLLACASAQAEFATFAWDPSPTPGLAGYRLYWGTSPTTYDHVLMVPATMTQAAANGLLPGRAYYFAATALSTNGLESDYSNQVGYRAPVVVPTPVFNAAVFEVRWAQDTFFRDTLEMSVDLVKWAPVPGPYPVKKGIYHARVPMDKERLFFRVRRDKSGKK